MRCRALLCLLGFLLCAMQPLAGQQPAYVQLWEAEYGHTTVYDIIQDHRGHYYISTDQGVFSFDGSRHKACVTIGVRSPEVFGFVANKAGEVFAHNLDNQVLKLQQDTVRVLYELRQEEQAADLYMSIDAQERLLVLTKTLVIIGPDGQVERPMAPKNYYGYPFLLRNGATVAHSAGKSELLYLEGSKAEVRPLTGLEGPSVQTLLKFFRVGDQSYAFSSLDRMLFRFDEDRFALELMGHFAVFPMDVFIRYYPIAGQLWAAGMKGGLQVIRMGQPVEASGIWFKDLPITDIYEDHEGNILVGTSHHGVLMVPDLNQPDVVEWPGEDRPIQIERTGSGSWLLGTDKGRLLEMQAGRITELIGPGASPMKRIHAWKGSRFAVIDNGRTRVVDLAARKVLASFERSLKCAMEWNTDTLLLGLNLGLSFLVHEGNGRIKLHVPPILRSRTHALARSPNGATLYMATADGLKYAARGQEAQPILLNDVPAHATCLLALDSVILAGSHLQGLLTIRGTQVIHQERILIDGANPQWIDLQVHGDRLLANTNLGLIELDMRGRRLPGRGLVQERIFDFEVDGDSIWLCQARGLQQISLSGTRPKVKVLPRMNLLAVFVNDSIVPHASAVLGLPSGSYKFRFQVSAPVLRNRQQFRYQYMLKGYDKAWQVASLSEPHIIYNALPPGEFEFVARVVAAEQAGEAVRFRFSIAAPLMQRPWFIVLLALAAAGLLLLGYRYFTERSRRRARLLAELNTHKIKAIQSQMNPHFIFNALNSIQELVLKGDTDEAYDYINQFALLVRKTLANSELDFIDTKDELELLRLYLLLEKLRFREDFDYEIHAEDIDDKEIPPMLIQPFVENALAHGLLHKEGLRRLRLSLTLDARTGQVICVVEDNGIGRARAREIQERRRGGHVSFAMGAISRRLAIYKERFGGEIGAEYEDLEEDGKASGTRVVIRLPTQDRY